MSKFIEWAKSLAGGKYVPEEAPKGGTNMAAYVAQQEDLKERLDMIVANEIMLNAERY